ncbi:carboxylic acid transporter [Marasmius fiardii PR-910]|nr:carboxylic acid transporter [Marasmius fiardii PR-910]
MVLQRLHVNKVFLQAQKSSSPRPTFKVLLTLTWVQWAQFFIGWFSWFCDCFDTIVLPLSVVGLTKAFGKSTEEITLSITLSQILRPVGAIVAGILSDRYGRKWPTFFILVFVGILQIAAGFVNNFGHFLILRSAYGLGLGGIWSIAHSTALENLPVELRGVAGAVVTQASAFSYIIGAVFSMTLVEKVSFGWKLLFWISGGASSLAAAMRLLVPESEVFLAAQEREKKRIREGGKATSHRTKTGIFLKQMWKMLEQHWVLLIHLSLLVLGLKFMYHGSQDLYPTYLQETKMFSARDTDVATIIAYCGAVAGGSLFGLTSQFIGRRLTMILCIIFSAAFIPLWVLPSSFNALAAGAFLVQAGVLGATGVLPIFLSEISPPAFRATFAGLVYNLANAVAGTSAPIETAAGNKLKIRIVKGAKIEITPNYAMVQGLFVGISAVWSLLFVIFSPENHGSDFEKHQVGYEESSAAVPETQSPVDGKDHDKSPVQNC